MPLYTTNAIVLRRMSFSETDRIVTLYTREQGKTSSIAKGARKPISRLSGSTETLTYGKVQLATGKNLDVITQFEVKESFPRIRGDLKRLTYAGYVAELVDVLTEDRQPSIDLFDLLLSALYLMERPNGPEKIARMFELKLMRLLGYEPALEECLRCRKPLPACPDSFGAGDLFFSPSLGGMVCRECGPLPDDAIQIPQAAIQAMKALLEADAPEVERMEIPNSVMDYIARVMRWYIRYRAEREIKSLDFLQALKVTG